MFKYIPSAHHPYQHDGTGLYIRYKKHAHQRIEIVAEGVNHQLIKAPDRDLLLVKNLHWVDSYRPIDENWDELVVFSPHSPLWKDFGVEYLMTNYISHSKDPEASLLHCKEGRHKPDGVTWIADSGAYQLASGKANYIDPAKLAAWYNDNVHIGLALDLPAGNFEDLLERSSKIQQKNNKIMLEIIRPPVHFMNIVHGSYPETYNRYHDVTDDDRINHIAVSDIYRGTSVEGLSNLCHIMEEWRPYKQYHILGVFKLQILMQIIRAATTRYKNRLITSDTSTAMQKSITWNYYVQRNLDAPMQQYYIGMNNTPYVTRSTTFRTLPCSCPVCSRIKYADILGRMAKTSYYMLMYHNLLEINRYVKLLVDLSSTMDDQQYLELVRAHLGRKAPGLTEVEQGLKFLQATETKCLKKANKIFNYWFATRLGTQMLTKDDTFFTDDVAAVQQATRDDLSAIMDSYEKGSKLKERKHKHKERKNLIVRAKQAGKRKK